MMGVDPLVEKLRDAAIKDSRHGVWSGSILLGQAADRIEQLHADRGIKPLSECTVDDLVNYHALVYGRCRIWTHDLDHPYEMTSRWSIYAWWKAMWYSHQGSPRDSAHWSVYAGCDGFTGPGDAELTHFMRIPPVPDSPPEQPSQGEEV